MVGSRWSCHRLFFVKEKCGACRHGNCRPFVSAGHRNALWRPRSFFNQFVGTDSYECGAGANATIGVNAGSKWHSSRNFGRLKFARDITGKRFIYVIWQKATLGYG